jgi:hypothetical protein
LESTSWRERFLHARSIRLLLAEHPVAQRRRPMYLIDADSIISSLDRSPTVAYWDENLTRRFLGLTNEEYDVLREWLLSFSGSNDVHYGEDALMRAYETVDLFQRETDRIRRESQGQPG